MGKRAWWIAVLVGGVAAGLALTAGAVVVALSAAFKFRQWRLGAKPPRGAPPPVALSAALEADLARAGRRAARGFAAADAPADDGTE